MAKMRSILLLSQVDFLLSSAPSILCETVRLSGLCENHFFSASAPEAGRSFWVFSDVLPQVDLEIEVGSLRRSHSCPAKQTIGPGWSLGPPGTRGPRGDGRCP